MEQKKSAAKNITVILFILFMIYILVCSVLAVEQWFAYSLLNQAVVLVVAITAVLIVWLVMNKVHAKEQNTKKNTAFLSLREKSCVLTIIIVAGICMYFVISGFGWQDSGAMRYYDMAVAIVQNSLYDQSDVYISFFQKYPQSGLYICILSILFSIFGIHIQIAYFLNMLLQICTAFFVYRIARKLAGAATGIIALMFTLFMPIQLYGIRMPDAALLGRFFLMALLFAYIQMHYKDDHQKPTLVLTIFSGIGFGLLLAMSLLTSFSVLFYSIAMLLGVFLLQNKKSVLVVPAETKSSPAYVWIFILLGFAGGMAGLLLFIGSYIQQTIPQMLTGYMQSYLPEFSLLKYVGVLPWILVKLSFLKTTFSFWNETVIFQNPYLLISSIIIMVFLVIYMLAAASQVWVAKIQAVRLFMWFALIDVVLVLVYTTYTVAGQPAVSGIVNGYGTMLDFGLTTTFPREFFIIIASCGISAVSIHPIKKEVNEYMSEQESTVKFIENPLPVPKKHVAKVMDFDIDVEKYMPYAGYDEFDLEISEDDDFDI